MLPYASSGLFCSTAIACSKSKSQLNASCKSIAQIASTTLHAQIPALMW